VITDLNLICVDCISCC